VESGVIERAEAEKMAEAFDERMQEARRWVTEKLEESGPEAAETAEAKAEAKAEAEASYRQPDIDPGGTTELVDPATVDVAVPADRLARINEAINSWPDDFHVFPKLAKQLERRRDQAEKGMDWAHAESLALGSLLEEGVPIRLTGEDTQRGTFSQRHSVLHDVETGAQYIPLTDLSPDQAWFQVWNSPLSEVACLGFEYGYSVFSPDALVLWEAQFGDFANVAQAIIDQFIVSGRSKWGLESRLVLLLPHGYEGQGPEHSSARLERFLDLAAEENIRVANCSTPAQYFYLLRLQGLREDRRPLIVMTPKSLLRHPEARSPMSELTDGSFRPVLPGVREDPAAVKRLVLCSGKVFYDLTGSEGWEAATSVDVARIELLYPFPAATLEAVIGTYPALEEVVWMQEEPENMGAWRYIRGALAEVAGLSCTISLVARPERASPAAGTAQAHAREQQELIERALG
jgi:2-oxoglutarate dehydrogenase E1 component